MNQYLIPANSKRSMLILGLFEKIDLMIFGVGAAITFFLMIFMEAETLKSLFIILTPVLISLTMVLPIPNHRNLWNFTANVYNYLSNQRTYKWRGWCVLDDEGSGEENR